MTKRDTIIKILTDAFQPSMLEVIDESYKHIGHAGHREGGETHFKVVISSAQLSGNRLAQHRQIMKLLGELNIHALSVEIKS